MTDGRTPIPELLTRVLSDERRDEDLESDIASSFQYLPDTHNEYKNVRRHPHVKCMVLYDAPSKPDLPTWAPMLTSSLDAVEKLRSRLTPAWRLDAVMRQEEEFVARASSASGEKVQAVARSEVRARLATVLQAIEKSR